MTEPSVNLSSPNRADPPLFNRLGDTPFEEMCCSLLSHEPDIIHAELYNARYEGQYGVDIIGKVEGGKIDVVSCKVRQKLESTSLSDFSDEFLKNWEGHWKSKGVRRFILAVTVDLKSSTRQKQLQKEYNRFKDIGVEYEYWANRQLQEKLRPHHGIATQYLGETLANQICGNPNQQSLTNIAQGSDVINFALVQHTEDLRAAYQSEIDFKFTQCQLLLSEGKYEDVSNLLHSLQEDKIKWGSLTSKQQARTYRFEGHVALCKSDLELAEEKAKLADCINPAIKEPSLNTLVTFQQSGADTALDQMLDVIDTEGLQFKASLLIEAGKYIEAENILDDLHCEDSNVAENNRLKAYCSYLKGDILSALSYSKYAVELDPKSILTLRTHAIIKYVSALAIAKSKQNLEWPNPIDFDLVKLDEASQKNLKDAENDFRQLTGMSQNQESIEEYQTWVLACLFNQFSEQNQAVQYVNELLQINASHVGAIVWSTARGVPFDENKSLISIEKVLQNKPNRKDLILAAASIKLSLGKTKRALEWLQKHSGLFQPPHEKELLENWIAQTRLNKGDSINDISNWPLGLQIGYRLKNINAEEDEWIKVSNLIQSHSDHENYRLWILNFCRFAAQKNKWIFVNNYRKTLLEIGTPTAIELSAISDYNCGDSNAALQTIEEYKTNFPNSRTSFQLQRVIRNISLENGDVPKALKIASQLATETTDLDDKISLVETLVRKGDISTALPHIVDISESGKLKPNYALHIAQIAALESNELAQKIIKDNNILNSIEVSQHGNLLNLLFQTGMESDAQTLLSEAATIGSEEGSICRVEDIEIIKHICREKQEALQKSEELYRKAQLPIHCLCSLGDVNLAAFYFASLNKENHLNRASIYISSGRKKISMDGVSDDLQIYADITALLTAFRLGCLDEVLDGFGQIFIPQSLPQALINLENNSGYNNPEWIRNIHIALENRKIGFVSDKQTEENEILVDQFKKLDDLTISKIFWVCDEDNQRIPSWNDKDVQEISYSEFYFHLISTGLVEAVHDEKNKLESPKDITDIDLSEDSCIGFDRSVLIRLIDENCFDQSLNNFQILISHDDALFVLKEKKKADAGRKLKTQLSTLRLKISNEIGSGRINLISQDKVSPEVLSKLSDHKKETSPIEAPLFELLSLTKQENGIIWTDDRVLNSYTNANENQILGIVEILKALRIKNKISEKRYFELIFNLRSCGAMFIHIVAEEIIYALKKSRINGLSVVETPTLKTLKRYIALACLQEENLLIRKDNSAHPEMRTDEMFLLVNLLSITRRVIPQIWLNKKISIEHKKAWSLWVWNELRTDQFETLPLHQQNDDGTKHIICLQFAALLSSVFELVGNEAVDPKEYISWIKKIAYEPFVKSQPETIPIIADLIRSNFSSVLKQNDENISKEELRYLRTFVNQLVDLLPEELMSLVLDSEDFSKALGRVRINSIHIAEKEFDSLEFWVAIRKAIEVGSSEISPIDTSEFIKITSHAPDDLHSFSLDEPINALINEPFVGLLSSDQSQQKSAINDNRYDLDLSRSEADDYFLKMSSLDPEQRMLKTTDHLYKGLRYRYNALADDIKREGCINWNKVTPPNPHELFRFIRFSSDVKEFDLNLDSALGCLSDDFDLIEAFNRLSTFPSLLPLDFRKKILSHFENDFIDQFEILKSGMLTPLARFHLLSLVQIQENLTSSQNKLSFSISEAINHYSDTSDAFCSILNWVEREVVNREDWKLLNQEHKLSFIWLHAEHLCRSFFEVGIDPLWLKDTFDEAAISRDHRDHFKSHDNAFIDASCPNHVTKEAILFYGLCQLFTDKQINDLSEEEISKLRHLLSNDNNEKFPAYYIAYSRHGAHDSLSSIFLANRDNLAFHLWGNEGKELFSKETTDAHKENILSAKNDEMNASDFLRHLLILGPWQIAINNDQVLSALMKRGLLEYETSGPEEILEYLRAFVPILSWLKLDTDKEALFQNFQSLSVYLGSKYADQKLYKENEATDLKTNLAYALLDCLFSSCRSDSGLESAENFSNQLTVYTQNWPEIKPLVETVLRNIIDGMPVAWRSPLWKALWISRT